MNKKLAKLALLSVLSVGIVQNSYAGNDWISLEFKNLRNIKHDIWLKDGNKQPINISNYMPSPIERSYTYKLPSCVGTASCSSVIEIVDNNAVGAKHIMTIYYDIKRTDPNSFKITGINYVPDLPYVTRVFGNNGVYIYGDGDKYKP